MRDFVDGTAFNYEQGQRSRKLFAAVVLAGLMQIAFGLLGLGKFARLVPHPVMFGFLNGLAIVILLAQNSSFQVTATDAAGLATTSWLTGTALTTMAGLVALTMAIIYLLPKCTKAVPAALVDHLALVAVISTMISTTTYRFDR